MRKNIDPMIWGNNAWKFLNDCALACDTSSEEHYAALMNLLPHVLPCSTCRKHASEYIRENPVDTKDLPGWLTRFRAHIRNQKRKKQQSPPWSLIIVAVLLFSIVMFLFLKRICT